VNQTTVKKSKQDPLSPNCFLWVLEDERRSINTRVGSQRKVGKGKICLLIQTSRVEVLACSCRQKPTPLHTISGLFVVVFRNKSHWSGK
jgi:hypothetical protein